MIKIREIISILLLALPLMVTFLSQKCLQLIDTFMLGQIGPNALAAGAVATSIFLTIIVFCMGTLSSVGISISRAKGANDSNDIKSSLQQGLIVSALLSLPCILIIWSAPFLLSRLGINCSTTENIILLLHGFAWGVPGFLLFLCMREFISAFSLTRVIMLITLTSIPLTFLGDYLLLYGKYHFPKLGIAGIAYSSSGIMWFMFLYSFIYSKKHQILNNYITFNSFKFDRKKIISILYVGIPSGILLVLESSMFLSAAIMMGYFGVTNLAAYQIAMQCAAVAYSIPLSLSMTTGLLVGNAVGAKNVIQLHRSTFLCLSIALFFSSAIALIFLFFPEILIKLFIHNGGSDVKEIIRLSTLFLSIAALFQCIDAIQTIANGALRGIKDTLIPMLISIGCYWLVGICCAYYFSFHTSFGAIGIWYGLTLALFATGILMVLRLLRKIIFNPIIL